MAVSARTPGARPRANHIIADEEQMRDIKCRRLAGARQTTAAGSGARRHWQDTPSIESTILSAPHSMAMSCDGLGASGFI